MIINITPDHLDRYDSMDDYAAAKANVFRNQTASDFAALNADDERVSKMDSLTEARTIFSAAGVNSMKVFSCAAPRSFIALQASSGR